MLLLFTAGLDTYLGEPARAWTTAAKVAVLGALPPFASGLAGGLAFHYATGEPVRGDGAHGDLRRHHRARAA